MAGFLLCVVEALRVGYVAERSIGELA